MVELSLTLMYILEPHHIYFVNIFLFYQYHIQSLCFIHFDPLHVQMNLNR